MFLSNQQAAVIALLIVIFAAAGCSWFQSGEPVALSPIAVAPPDTGIPFETKQPNTYQADFVTIASGIESSSHFARKAGRWRFDSFDPYGPSRSIVRSETLVYIDHGRKQYSEPPANGHDAQPEFVEDLTTSLLNEKRPARFEKLASEGAFERYSVTVDRSNVPSTIVYDPSINMVVRHEFEGGFAFEMRNFTLDVDDAIFSVPAGYRKVPWTVFEKQ